MVLLVDEPLSLEDAVAPQLHKRLRSLIVSCEFLPGQRISETEIASTYGISRQPVREAFIKLAEEGLVSVRPQRGTYIQRISVPDALTARFVREAVETDLVRRVIDRKTPEMIAGLERQIEMQRIATQAEDPVEFMRLDEAFHRLIAHYAEVPAVSEYLEVLNVQMNRVRNISARQFSPKVLVVQHSAIVDAIRLGDEETAVGAIRTHLREFNKDLPRIIKAYPDYFIGQEVLS